MWQPYAESRLVTSAGCRFHRWSEPRIHHRATLAEQRAAHTRPRCGVWRIIANVRRRSWRRCTRGLAREETCELGSKFEDGAGDVTAGDYQWLETVRSGKCSDYVQRIDIIGAELCHFEHNICNKRPMPREEPK